MNIILIRESSTISQTNNRRYRTNIIIIIISLDYMNPLQDKGFPQPSPIICKIYNTFISKISSVISKCFSLTASKQLKNAIGGLVCVSDYA